MLSTTCWNVVLHPVNKVVLHPVTTVVNNHCSKLFTVNNHCSIIVDNHQQAFFINFCRLLFQQHCNNYISIVNKCCCTLTTTLFRHCSANNVASTWWIFARVLLFYNFIFIIFVPYFVNKNIRLIWGLLSVWIFIFTWLTFLAKWIIKELLN